jgi:signal transduction histidine kinase
MLPHVFEMFVQSPSARKRAEGGLGIGPAVVKYLVSAHNGTIPIASAGERAKRPTQHTEDCASSRSLAVEARTLDLLHG